MSILPSMIRRFVALIGGTLALLGLGVFLFIQVFSMTSGAARNAAVSKSPNGPLPYVFKQVDAPNRSDSDIIIFNVKFLLEEYAKKSSSVANSFNDAGKSFSYPLNTLSSDMEAMAGILLQMEGVVAYGETLGDSMGTTELRERVSRFILNQRSQIEAYRQMVEKWKADASLAPAERQRQLSELKVRFSDSERQVESELAGELQSKLKDFSLRMED